MEFLDDFLVETFLPESMLAENTKFDELLVENLAEFISQMNFTMVSMMNDNCV